MAAPLAAVLCLLATPARACGPDFPNTLLDRGDNAVLTAPIADFYRELSRIKLPGLKFRGSVETNESQSMDADLGDLRSALKKAQVPTHTAGRILALYELARFAPARAEKPRTDAQDHAENTASDSDTSAAPQSASEKSEAPAPSTIEGLPGEFADYLRGADAWHAGQLNEARVAWEVLLQRPEAERHYRSTWAAYMLGRYWHSEEPDKAIEYYQQVRSLAEDKFADSLGLAVSSLGWEAQIYFSREEYQPALKLYQEQYASGDPTAGPSLRIVAKAASEAGADVLQRLAADPFARRILSAYTISIKPSHGWAEETHSKSFAKTWLKAVEGVDVQDMESAEQLALAAYQAGEWQMAQGWLNHARSTPTAQWLQAKLMLRAGKVDQAASLLAKVARLFPVAQQTDSQPAQPSLKDSLFVEGHSYLSGEIDAPSQVLGELGVFHLARREYTEALDALLRAGFWLDAAYVAERVLSVVELKSYVDRNWLAVVKEERGADGEEPMEEKPKWNAREEIRYLLARRLTRLHHADEAREYFPAEWLPDLDALTQNLKTGWDESLPAQQRARALFEAAKIARHKGMELLGTEVEPDWHVHDGQFEEGVWVSTRATNDQARALVASKDEIKRAQRHNTDPEERFHYRYQAAALAWEAAKLMPNNSDETARVLCTAGSWIKNRDPEAADVLYKALVRRCRKTAIGDQADRMRWFPILDDNGDLVPWEPEPPTEAPLAEPEGNADPNQAPAPERAGGFWYVLHRGNALQDVVDVVRSAHNLQVTVKELLEANPGVHPARLKVGQKVFVPAPHQVETERSDSEILPRADSSGTQSTPWEPLPQ